MKFFQTHFTKHHLLHSPHKWFLALLISPIHVAEMHYKNRYHINFVHAKKLFVFDMALVLSIFLLLAGTIFWFIYDPTVTKDVALSFQTTQTRINSGEKIVFTAHYQNNSEVLLTNASLGLRLPNSLVITSAEPKDSFDEQNNTFYLQNLVPGSSGEVNISGILYGEVDKEYNNTAILTYNQEERSASEQVVASTITILRNSVLQASIEAPTAILSHSTVPITLKIKNNGELLLENIKIPLSDVENFSISPIEEPKVGTVESGSWIITNLAPGREVEIKLNMTSNINEASTKTSLYLTPIIIIKEIELKQKSTFAEFEIVRPDLNISANWQTTESIQPGTDQDLLITLTNNGTSVLNNFTITLPIPSNIVNSGRIANLNAGYMSGSNFITNSKYHANLKQLDPGKSTSVTLKIPIRAFITSLQDINLSLSPKVSATVPNIPNAEYERSTETSELKIGTNINLNAISLYYTEEGDQLGRGPLPPQVGKETKYWAIISIENTSSQVRDLQFFATLPSYIGWTGRTSVSHGNDVTFNTGSRQATWQLNSLGAYETTGIYVELALTPSPGQVGTTPILLQNITISAVDNYTGATINASVGSIDASLPNDSIAQSKGVRIE